MAQRKEQLLDAALEEFGTRGVLQTGVKDIRQRAQVTDRYFYESFANTEHLFVAVFDRAAQQLYDLVIRRPACRDGGAALPAGRSSR